MSESSAVPPTPPSVGLHPELAAAAASVAHVTEHLRALTASMTDTQFNWHPKVGEWSVAEVLDHLTTLHNLMLPRFVQGMAQAREQGWQPNPHKPPKPGPLGKLFIWTNQPHAWTKIKTPRTLHAAPRSPTSGGAARVLCHPSCAARLYPRYGGCRYGARAGSIASERSACPQPIYMAACSRGPLAPPHRPD